MKKMNFCASLCTLLGWERFTELFLSNIIIMKYSKNDIEWQTSIQGMILSDFGDYLRKSEENFNIWHTWSYSVNLDN